MSRRFFKTTIEITVWTPDEPLDEDGGWISRAISEWADNEHAHLFYEEERTAVFQLSGKEMAEALHKHDQYIELAYYGLNEAGETIYSKATCVHCNKEIDVTEDQKLVGHPGSAEASCSGSGQSFEKESGTKIGRRS